MAYRPHDSKLTAMAFSSICGSLAFLNRDSDIAQNFETVAAQSGAFAIAADQAFVPYVIKGQQTIYVSAASGAWASCLGKLGTTQADYAEIAGSICALTIAVDAYVKARDPMDTIFANALMGTLAGAYLFERYTILDQAGWAALIAKTAPFAEAVRAAFPPIASYNGALLALCSASCQGRSFGGAPMSAYAQMAADIAGTALSIVDQAPPSEAGLVSGCFMMGCAGQYAQTQPTGLGGGVSVQALALADAIAAAYPAMPLGVERQMIYQNVAPGAANTILTLRQGGPVADWTPTAAKVAELYSAMIAWWNANINAGPS